MTSPNGTISYDYDVADRRKNMTAGGQTTSYGFDKSSILTSVSSGTQEIGFGLDVAGREKIATMPGGITRTTGYDAGVGRSISRSSRRRPSPSPEQPVARRRQSVYVVLAVQACSSRSEG